MYEHLIHVINALVAYFSLNGPSSASFLIIFVFSDKHYNAHNKYMSCPSSIRRQDLNPRPSEHESPPITTRPMAYLLIMFSILMSE